MEKYSLRNYVILFAIIAIASFFGRQLQHYYEDMDKDEEYELIRKFLLNDAQDGSLHGTKKPKLWIHTTYGINARQWKSFYSRNSTDLNQPYLHLTIQSIVQHCGSSFHICLIDDESFSKLIPSWSVGLSAMPEPFRQRFREYGLATLLYMYGGMVVPNSFICFRDLAGLYQEGMMGARGTTAPFVCERPTQAESIKRAGKRLLFAPDPYIMGCKSGDVHMAKYMEYLRQRNIQQHFQSQTEFLGDSAHWLLRAVEAGEFNLLDGTNAGVKTTRRQVITLEDLMEEAPLDLAPGCYGVFIPAEAVLTRHKYQWLASISPEELYRSNLIVAKYLAQALAPGSGSRRGEGVGTEVEITTVDVLEIKYVIPSTGGM
jgi:hypothetical protein